MVDQKITELAELTIPEEEDLLAIVDDVVGSPETKKIEVGNVVSYGKNLIQNASFQDSDGDDLLDFWALSGTPTLAIAPDTLFPGRKGNQITITCVGNTYEGIIISPGVTNWLKVLPFTKYTFSIDYKATVGDFASILVRSYNGAAAGTIHINVDTLDSTSAVRVTYTFTTDADADNLFIEIRGKNDGDIVIFSHLKLEQGAIATPYVDETPLNYIQIDNYRKDLGTNPTGLFLKTGENLIQHSAFFDLNDDDLPVMWALQATPTLVIATDTLFPSRGGNQITITNTGATGEGIIIGGSATNWLKVLPSTLYTLSFDYKCTAGDKLRVQIKSYNDAAVGTSHVDDGTPEATIATRISYTFTTDTDANNLSILFAGRFDGDIVIYSHPKLEQGAIATPYILNEAVEEIKIIHYYHGYARAYPASDQDDIANSTWTHVTLGTEDYDLGDNFTASQFTVPVTGLYELSGQLTWEATAIVTNKIYGCAIWVDPLGAGADAEVLVVRGSSGPNNEELAYHVSDCLKLNATDEVRLYAFHNDGTGNPDIESGSANTSLSVSLVHLDT